MHGGFNKNISHSNPIKDFINTTINSKQILHCLIFYVTSSYGCQNIGKIKSMLVRAVLLLLRIHTSSFQNKKMIPGTFACIFLLPLPCLIFPLIIISGWSLPDHKWWQEILKCNTILCGMSHEIARASILIYFAMLQG